MPLAVWLDSFRLNPNHATGSQILAQSAGLSNGNIVTVWVDDTNNVDTAPGTDIIAQIYDPEGNAIGGPFQINTFAELDQETDPDIAALPNGEFIVVYEQNANDGDSDIHYQWFDSVGGEIREGNIALGAAGADQVRNPAIAVPSLQNGFPFWHTHVVFDRTSLGNTDVNGVYISNMGTVGPEHDNAQNSADFDREPDAAIIESNGLIVTVYEEDDNGTTSIEFSLRDQAMDTVTIDSLPFPGDDPHVAARTEDFRIVYEANGDISTMMFDADGDAIGGVFTFGSGVDTFDQPAIAAHDAGYVIAWRNSTDNEIYAQLVDPDGGLNGARITIATHATVTRPELSTLVDGRIMVTWEQSGDVWGKILDPREFVYTGSAFADVITARREGGTINCLDGNDTAYGQESADNLFGYAGDDDLFGGGANDNLYGDNGNDSLDGGVGVDKMTGGLGNDTYYLDEVMDATVEAANEGLDTVNAFITHALRVNIEELTLRGNANINGTGNTLDNLINGNKGSNILNGLAGGDVMQGGAGNDTYYVDNQFDLTLEAANQGSDIVHATLDWELSGEIERLYLHGTAAIGTGNDLSNWIYGNANGNGLAGMGGADRIWGYGGDDEYHKDSAGDLLYETIGGAAGGVDIVYSSVNHTLTTNFENLTMVDAGNVNATGNTVANVIAGNAGNNYIDGRQASDTLTGGNGIDQFLFTTALGAGNIDTVTDFDPAADFIRLDDAIFTALAAGYLAVAAFHTGAAAADAADRIIYNSGTGALLYDSDGTGNTAAVQFATLSAGLAMTNGDVFVF